jgi:hypothetical protein
VNKEHGSALVEAQELGIAKLRKMVSKPRALVFRLTVTPTFGRLARLNLKLISQHFAK